MISQLILQGNPSDQKPFRDLKKLIARQLTRKGKVKLEHRQNKASRHVYRAKHNENNRN